MAKKKFTAMIHVTVIHSYDVEIKWTGKGEPTEEDIKQAYKDGDKDYTFTENGEEEEIDSAEVSDIEEG